MNKHDNGTIALAQSLIERPSVTPEDFGCQQLMSERLAKLGFTNESMVFEDTTNLWSRRGSQGPVFCFAGHTDVVPAGSLASWHTPPFDPVIADGMLYGRGAADMKGSLAAMIVATERFVTDHPNHQGSIAFLITSDEEGPFINGTTRVIDTLEARNEKIDYCIVGEPSSTKTLGDVVKNGRRGSISGELTIHGKQGHVAYPEHVINPIHKAMSALAELSEVHWDNGNEYFPPTSFQLSNIQSGTGATNVIPGEVQIMFNLRFSTELTEQLIRQRVTEVMDELEVKYHIDWTLFGQPFLTGEAELVAACRASIKSNLGIDAQLSTSGGTSDGRFIAPTGAQVVELGPINESIHKVDENVPLDSPAKLAKIYHGVMQNLLVK